VLVGDPRALPHPTPPTTITLACRAPQLLSLSPVLVACRALAQLLVGSGAWSCFPPMGHRGRFFSRPPRAAPVPEGRPHIVTLAPRPLRCVSLRQITCLVQGRRWRTLASTHQPGRPTNCWPSGPPQATPSTSPGCVAGAVCSLPHLTLGGGISSSPVSVCDLWLRIYGCGECGVCGPGMEHQAGPNHASQYPLPCLCSTHTTLTVPCRFLELSWNDCGVRQLHW
jgi:hypothetical protein